ncbi:acylase [Nannocystis pusilla]|uniref:Acylase n=1 Tax=Nannocystis pusilla TaxID=889268 RepID=A0ABS7TW43_9BACT|nr:acylase [Nannocystis pusilla]MBZ5712399.1 acylase [Nannocystis pusilla]
MLRKFAVLALAPLFACGSSTATSTDTDTASSTGETGTSGTTGEPAYRATIRRTSYGVAHVQADDLGSVLFGQAYAFAQDHVCTLADQIVKVRAERAKYFGRGDGDAHLTSDFTYLALEVEQRAQRMWDATPADVKVAIEGYAAGYNQYLRDTPPGELPADCAGAPWVKEIEALDLVRYYVDLGLLGSSNQLASYIGTAQPPGAPLTMPGGPLRGLGTLTSGGFGSNGWALGADKTTGGGGMVVANPHFPWTGELKLWESHLTVPGEVNIYGVGLMGVPGVLIGFNDAVAWTHTFSSGNRFTFYKLALDPSDPTAYLYDGTSRPMTKKTFEVEVADGGTVTRTMYYSHYGPMLNVDPIGWSTDIALTYRDANIDNPRLIEQFLGMDRAKTLDEFKAVFQTVQGIPWVNTMAADKAGNAWYADASATPQLSDEAIAGWQAAIEDDFLTGLLYQQGGLVVLDGSDSTYEWVDSGDARAPGLVPFAGVPQLDRRDFVFNANDSYWLANPAAPLEGFSPLHGSERAPQSPRTRINAMLLQNDPRYAAAGDDGTFTLAEIQAAIQGNHSLTADLVLDDLLARCGAHPVVDVDGSKVDLRTVCGILGAWDRRFNPDSVGAVLFREYLAAYSGGAVLDRGSLFHVPFDPDDPIGTPHTLIAPAEGQADGALVALGEAARHLAEAGVPLSAPLKQLQRAPRGSVEIGVHGGFAKEGIANVVGYDGGLNSTLLPKVPRPPSIAGTAGLTERGYVINYGSSFVMAVEFLPEGPRGEAFLTYSQSEDPRSPHFRDQTELFSRKEWRPLLFREADIAADANLRETVVEGG